MRKLLTIGISTLLVALAILSVSLSFRANEISRERRATAELERSEIQPLLAGKLDEDEPITNFFSDRGVNEVVFNRGSDQRLRLEPEELKALKDLAHLKSLQIIAFDLEQEHIDAIPPLPNLQTLSWGAHKGTVNDGEALATLCDRFPNLRRLGLVGVHVDDEDLNATSTLDELNELFIDVDRVDGTFLEALASRNLESLQLASDGLTMQGFEELTKLPTLRYADLSGSAYLPPEALDVLPRLSHIDVLSFRIEPGDIPAEAIAESTLELEGRFSSLWPESYTPLGGDGWLYRRTLVQK